MTTSFRGDVTAAVVLVLDDFIATNPDRLRRSSLAQPPSVLGDLPIAYVASRDERIHFDAQTMDRVMTLQVLMVSEITDNVETVQKRDETVDLLVDHFNDNISFVPNSSWTDLLVSDEAFSVDAADGSSRQFYATRFTFVVSLMEGRA